MKKNILIADDNQEITRILADYVRHEGYIPHIAADGEMALKIFADQKIDLILLDVMMPKMDGFEVCRTIRRESSVPIIMVTARGDDFERILGLDIGADDYIVKPFSPAEVMARVRAILRRIDNHEEQKRLEIADLVIEADQNRAFINGKKINLTVKEAELLYLWLPIPPGFLPVICCWISSGVMITTEMPGRLTHILKDYGLNLISDIPTGISLRSEVVVINLSF